MVYEIVVLVSIFILGLFFSFGSIQIGIGNLNNPGPGFLPAITGFLAAVISIYLLFFRLKDSSGIKWRLNLSYKVYLVLASMAIYILLLNVLGFAVATFIFMLYLAKVLEFTGWVKPLAFSLISTLCAYYIFSILLKIPFPQGRLI